MHPVVNHLIQLQELHMVREEQQVTSRTVHLEQLNEAIRTMQAELPDQIRVMFEKLMAKNHNAIVPVTDGVCAACRVQLPISLVQQVRMAKEVQSCPSCARYLYMPVSGARNTRRRPGRFETQKPGISRFSASTLMLPDLEGTNGEDVLRELANALAEHGFVNQAESLVEVALRREALFSTAVDHGLAFPHVRGVEGGALTLAVGKSKKGVLFDSSSKQRTHLFFFMVIPTSASSFYLKLIAGLTETFMGSGARDDLMACESASDMWKALVKLTKRTIK